MCGASEEGSYVVGGGWGRLSGVCGALDLGGCGGGSLGEGMLHWGLCVVFMLALRQWLGGCNLPDV